MNVQLDAEQQAAVDAPLEQLVLICGLAGSGKSTALRARALRAGDGRQLSAASFCDRPGIETLAFQVLSGEAATGRGEPPELIDDVEASIVFEQAAEPLLALEWTELIESQIDPELAGLRAPQRFLENAFRLIVKLRDAHIGPDQFLERALQGATQFYAQPPNFAHPDLLYYTKDHFRNSLHVDRAELQRQHRREVDLAKVLRKLYRAYLDLLVERGALTASDAIAEATGRLISEGKREGAVRPPPLFIDDAQELTTGELLFLQALHGDDLAGVTLCGDPNSALGTFEGARPDRVFSLPGKRFELLRQYRCAALIERAARHIGGANAAASLPIERGHLTLFRASTKHAEVASIAEHLAQLLRGGIEPPRLGVIFRSVANVFEYEAACLARNIDVQVVGDLNLFNVPDVLDALALLWNVYDPFAHEWLLRTLSGPALNLSDATLIALCAEPGTSQTVLFTPDEVAPESERRRDPARDLRLGWNVTRGDQDGALTAVACERLREFRASRERWLGYVRVHSLPTLARKIFEEGLVARGEPGSARAKSQERNVHRLLRRIEIYAERRPWAGLAEFLAYATLRAQSNLEGCEEHGDDGAIRFLSVAAAAGREFDEIVVANVRAGSFPRYYVPDSFLFSPSLGMIAKENVGEARAARTAKFTYYMFAAKTREAYNREERRAFVYALRRARRGVLVTASEKPTRGMTTPEFLSELQAAGFPDALELSERSRAAR